MNAAVKAPKYSLTLPGVVEVKGDELHVRSNTAFRKSVFPLDGLTVQTVDTRGSRVTVTRALTIGLFAIGAKKRTGALNLIFVGRDGSTARIEVKNANAAAKALVWGAEFNAWNGAAA